MSKYWNKMEIFRGQKSSGKLFISEKFPEFFVSKKYEIEKNFSESELSNFYRINYNINNGTVVTLLSDSDIKGYINIDSEILPIKKNNIYIGCIISLLIPIRILTNLKIPKVKYSKRFDFFREENSLVFGCTSFLALDKKHRGKGYGMALIQESLKILYKNGGLGAYFINSVSRCKNSIKLFIWYFSFNTKNYSKLFKVPENDLIIKKIGEEEKYFEFYKNLVKNKKFAFSPSFLYWKKWIETFPTYIVLENSEIIGIFTFNSNQIRCPVERKSIKKGFLITCLGKQPETLKSALSISKDLFDVLEVYETGDMESSLLSSNNFQKYEIHKFVNFYNTQIFLHARDFYVPIF